MPNLTLRFHDALRDFLPYARRDRAFEVSMAERTAIKDVVEALGVPHTEVGALLVGGQPVDFAYRVRDGDVIEVYPVGAPHPAEGAPSLQPEPPLPPRFVLDVHLGRLAAYLRMLGFDTLYAKRCDDDVLARLSSGEGRILLTRDIGLLKRAEVTSGHFVRATDPERQLAEVCHRYALTPAIRPFTRCPRCNGILVPVARSAVLDRLPPKVAASQHEFRACQSCGQLYWKGTHHPRMVRMVERIASQPSHGWCAADSIAATDHDMET